MGLEKILQEMSKKVSAFGSASVVHREEGTAVASLGSDDPVDGATGDAYLAEMLKLHLAAADSLKLKIGETEDLVVRTTQGTLFARPLKGSDYIWTLLVGAEANVTLTRAMMRKYHKRIAKVLPK